MCPEDAESRSERSEGSQDDYPSESEETAHDGTHGAADTADSVQAVIDVHEPDHVWPELLQHPDVDGFREVELPSADIVVNGIGFERKTPSDFASSITEGRLVDQIDKMQDAFDHSYILIDGDMADLGDLQHSRLNPQSMRGMAASATARRGVPVIPCSDTETLVDIAVRIGRKHTEDPVSDHLPTGPVGDDEPASKRMWGCLPGVGPTMADRLHDAIGSPVSLPKNDPGWWEKRLAEVDGIGEITAEKIAAAMGEKYDD